MTRTILVLALLGGLLSAQTVPLPPCLQGTILPTYGDPTQGSAALWPNGIAPDSPVSLYLPSHTLSATQPPLRGPLDQEPLVSNFVTAPVVEANGGASLFIYVRSPLTLNSPNVVTQSQWFPSGLSIIDWAPTSRHWLLLYIRVNGSPWIGLGQFELAPTAVPGVGFAGQCGQPVVINAGWWTGQQIINAAGIITEDKPAAAWIGVSLSTPGTFLAGDLVEVAGVWGVEDTPGSPSGSPVTAYFAQPFVAVAR